MSELWIDGLLRTEAIAFNPPVFLMGDSVECTMALRNVDSKQRTFNNARISMTVTPGFTLITILHGATWAYNEIKTLKFKFRASLNYSPTEDEYVIPMACGFVFNCDTGTDAITYPSAAYAGQPDRYYTCLYKYDEPVLSGSLERCTEQGVLADEGTRLMANLKLKLRDGIVAEDVPSHGYTVTVTSSPTTPITTDLTAESLFAGVTDDINAAAGTFPADATYTVTVRITNGIETAELPVLVPRAFANIHESGNPLGGVAFGKYCDPAKAPAFECAYPAYMMSGIVGVTNFSYDEVDTGGTWLEDKKIYSKTEVWQGSKASGGTTELFTDHVYLDMLVGITGVVRRTNNTLYPLGTYISSSINVPVYWQNDRLTVRNVGFACDLIVATIYYTKATD